MHTYTGKIEVVFSDVVSGKNGLKKLIRVHIPEGEQTHTHTHTHTHAHHTGYDPVAKRITDQYRVVVSPKKVYLEPLKQLGLHEYLGVRSYNPCSIGRRVSLIPIPHTPMFLVKNFHSPILHTHVSSSKLPFPMFQFYICTPFPFRNFYIPPCFRSETSIHPFYIPHVSVPKLPFAHSAYPLVPFQNFHSAYPHGSVPKLPFTHSTYPMFLFQNFHSPILVSIHPFYIPPCFHSPRPT